VLTDDSIREIIEDFQRAAVVAREAGFDFIDISIVTVISPRVSEARTRKEMANMAAVLRTALAFCETVVNGGGAGRARLIDRRSASALTPFPFTSARHKRPLIEAARVAPETFNKLLPYRWGFGLNAANPLELESWEPLRFCPCSAIWSEPGKYLRRQPLL